MITERESQQTDLFAHPLDTDPRCEGCGASLIARFGGIPEAECPSCLSEFKLLAQAGKITDGDGHVMEFSFD